MTQMLAVRIHEFGGPEVLRIDSIPRPSPAAHEALVRVHAASLNPIDHKIRAGKYPPIQLRDLPLVLGRDICGEVIAVGGSVTNVRRGDRVYALLDSEHGGYAEYVAIDARLCCPSPRPLDDVDAAAVPLAAITAYQGLFEHGLLEAGQTVLIHGGSGGVGHMAVQLAKAKRARVITTVCGHDLQFVLELGADEAIDYHTQPFDELLREVDVVFDLVAGETQRRSFGVVKPGGRLVSTLGRPLEAGAHKRGVVAIGFTARPNPVQLREITALIEEGQLRPAVQGVYALNDVAAAHQRLEKLHTRGKLVLKLV